MEASSTHLCAGSAAGSLENSSVEEEYLVKELSWQHIGALPRPSVKGGFGTVFVGNRMVGKNMYVEVAVKVIAYNEAEKADVDNKTINVLLEEARVLQKASSSIVNDFIVKFHGLVTDLPTAEWVDTFQKAGVLPLNYGVSGSHGNDAQIIGLVMKYEGGGTLHELIHSTTNKWSANTMERLRVLVEIATGLWHLHNNHESCIIHGDIKSANVLLNYDSGVLHIRLADFGLSTATKVTAMERGSRRSTMRQSVEKRGTWPYMAPEMYSWKKTKGCAASRSTDVFSLGVLMHEVLSGNEPWDMYGEADRLAELRSGETLDLDECPIDTPITVRELILKCLSLDRAQRPQIETVRAVLTSAYEVMQSRCYDVFLSYAWGKDDKRKPLANEIFSGLTRNGYNVWMDSNLMDHDMKECMKNGIRDSKIIVVVLTPDYVASRDCMFELRTALSEEMGKESIVCMAEKGYWKDWKDVTSGRPCIDPAGEVAKMLRLNTHLYADYGEAADKDWSDEDTKATEFKLLTDDKALPRLLQLLESKLRPGRSSSNSHSHTSAGVSPTGTLIPTVAAAVKNSSSGSVLDYSRNSSSAAAAAAPLRQASSSPISQLSADLSEFSTPNRLASGLTPSATPGKTALDTAGSASTADSSTVEATAASPPHTTMNISSAAAVSAVSAVPVLPTVCSLCYEDLDRVTMIPCNCTQVAQKHAYCSKCFENTIVFQLSPMYRFNFSSHDSKIVCLFSLENENISYFTSIQVVSYAPDKWPLLSRACKDVNDEFMFRIMSMRRQSRIDFFQQKLQEAATVAAAVEESAVGGSLDQKAVYSHCLNILQNILLSVRCPHPQCGHIVDDFYGSFAITCSLCSTKYCGWCLGDTVQKDSSINMDANNELYEHVENCPLNKQPHSCFGSLDDFLTAHSSRWAELTMKYLLSLDNKLVDDSLATNGDDQYECEKSCLAMTVLEHIRPDLAQVKVAISSSHLAAALSDALTKKSYKSLLRSGLTASFNSAAISKEASASTSAAMTMAVVNEAREGAGGGLSLKTGRGSSAPLLRLQSTKKNTSSSQYMNLNRDVLKGGKAALQSKYRVNSKSSLPPRQQYNSVREELLARYEELTRGNSSKKQQIKEKYYFDRSGAENLDPIDKLQLALKTGISQFLVKKRQSIRWHTQMLVEGVECRIFMPGVHTHMRRMGRVRFFLYGKIRLLNEGVLSVDILNHTNAAAAGSPTVISSLMYNFKDDIVHVGQGKAPTAVFMQPVNSNRMLHIIIRGRPELCLSFNSAEIMLQTHTALSMLIRDVLQPSPSSAVAGVISPQLYGIGGHIAEDSSS